LAAPLLTAASGGEPAIVRIATFNASLNRAAPGALIRDLTTPDNSQAQRIAAIVQHVRPDILLINEFDYDAHGEALRLFRTNYLGRAQVGEAHIDYPYAYSAPVNTGMPAGFDLNRDGRIDASGQDALGFGFFPGQYGMLVLSRYPIEAANVRSFQHFLWRDMPGALLPDDWYSPEALAVLPLSSKSHWDVPIRIGKRVLHVLASHPTPPAFDGPEDRNGRRNHDEIRLWVDYLTPRDSRYLYDDAGARGGLRGRDFVILGDLNADPLDGDSRSDALRELLAHPRVQRTAAPASAGASEAARVQGGANDRHRGPAGNDTADFDDRAVGNLRVDYVLPSRTLPVCDSGVFWPTVNDPLRPLSGPADASSSDHHLVWMDVALTAQCKRSSVPTGQ